MTSREKCVKAEAPESVPLLTLPAPVVRNGADALGGAAGGGEPFPARTTAGPSAGAGRAPSQAPSVAAAPGAGGVIRPLRPSRCQPTQPRPPRSHQRTHGDPCCQGAWGSGPVACVRLPGWSDCFVPLADSCRLSGCRVVRGPAGAPGAAQWRGRTSWTAASCSRSSEARKRFSAGVGGVGGAGSLVFPGCAVCGVVSHAPIRHLPGGGAMTVLSGDRAAQSGHRARLGRLMRFCELTRGLATPPGW